MWSGVRHWMCDVLLQDGNPMVRLIERTWVMATRAIASQHRSGKYPELGET